MISAARNDWRRNATGVTVRVFYVDRQGLGLRELAPQQLLSAPNAATVEALVGTPVVAVDDKVRERRRHADVVNSWGQSN